MEQNRTAESGGRRTARGTPVGRTADWLTAIETRVRNLYVLVTVALGGLSVVVFGVAAVAPEAAATILFTYATVTAAIAFHLFSVGNAAYSCAASLGNDDLFRLGTKINENGVHAAVGAGAVLFSAVLWRPLVVDSRVVPWIPGATFQAVLLAGVAVGVLVALRGIWRQRRYSWWYEYTRSVAARRPDGAEQPNTAS